MPKQEGQKSKLLTLLRILEQKTDEEHLLNVPQLVELLEQQDILAERKSIYSDIDTLRSLGYDIQLRRGRGGGYWLASRTFELSELKLLVDAVQASKVVSARPSSKLIHKLEALCSDYEGTQLQRQVYVDGRPKSDSHTLLYSIDALHSAINAGRMVRFRYKDDGTRTVSPWQLAWENGCASARRYRDSHSDLLVPVHYKDKDGFALGEWIVYNRQRYLGGNLPSDRVERLEALGMVWDTGSILWEKSYAAAVQYYLENHTLEIPVKYVTPDGMALGVWLGSQRAAYKEGMLTDAQIEKLEALGVDWANRNDRKWQTAYEAAVKYHAAHGNLDVPTEYIDEDGILLGKWVSRQRYAWQNPERSSARVTLERKALLDELGMNWEKTDSWQHRYELAVEYKKEHGSLAVPAQYRTEDGIWLGSWLSRQKQMLREGKKLSAERRAALKELFKGEKGRRLSAPVPPACSVREQNWLDNYQSARLYAEKKGSLLVPAGYVDENGFRLGVWISNLRAARKARPGSFQVTPEHIALLDAIGMQWDAREAKWAGAFRRAEEYCAAHGNLLVPVNYKTEDGFCLGDWVRRMRENYACAEKKLTAERIAKLEALGMVWTVPQEG